MPEPNEPEKPAPCKPRERALKAGLMPGCPGSRAEMSAALLMDKACPSRLQVMWSIRTIWPGAEGLRSVCTGFPESSEVEAGYYLLPGAPRNPGQ